MKTYLLPIFALLIVGCGTHQPEQTYDEMLNDVVLNFNVGTVGGDSIINAFVKNYPNVDSLRRYMPPVDKIKEGMMEMLISNCIDAGQFDNAQHLYDNMLKYADCSRCEISVYLGFSSVSYFSRCFKKRKGESPKEYRKQNHFADFTFEQYQE